MGRAGAIWVSMAACAALTACGGGGSTDKDSSSGSGAAGSAANQGGGGDYKTIKDGTLTVGTNLPFAPLGMFESDGKTMTGAEIDMMRAVADEMGLKADIQNTAWDGLIPAAKANRYDIVWASIGDFEERRGDVDFVDYLKVTSAVVVRAEDAGKVTEQMDLCGLRGGATKGAATVTTLQQFSEECKKAGKPEIQVNQFPSTAEGLTALRSKRIDAECMDGPVAVYKATVDKEVFAMALPSVGTEIIYGIGVSKQNTALRDAIQKALQATIDDGEYGKILDKYGLGDYAIDEASINKGGSKAG